MVWEIKNISPKVIDICASNLGLRAAGQLALEHQPVAIVLLPELRLLHEARGDGIPGGAHGGGLGGPLTPSLPGRLANALPASVGSPENQQTNVNNLVEDLCAALSCAKSHSLHFCSRLQTMHQQ